MTMTTAAEAFSTLPLLPALLDNLESLGYKAMTPIQAQSLPLMLKHEDVLAKAKTGSGKTAAFGLSILHHLNVNHYAIQALVLCPTRELAEQVSQALRRLARSIPNIKVLNLSGGVPMTPQLDSLRHGAHIIVGTPGRIQKHLDKGSLSFKHLQTLVLDEADRMLDMGFYDDIEAIILNCPKKRQTLLFSATYPESINKLCQQFMQNPKEIVVESTHTTLDIEQRFYEVANTSAKLPLLKTLLSHYKPTSTLIFCNQKMHTTALANALNQSGFDALALHGDMEQHDRDQVIVRFTNRSCSILVATDVAARGIDIKELPAVINYDVAFDADVHIHRIGRTGRAGHKGLALTLALPAEAPRICMIEQQLDQTLIWDTIHSLDVSDDLPVAPEMTTLCIDAGRKDKIRPGDVLGALTKDAKLPGTVIGKIDIATLCSYVAIKRSHADKAFRYFKEGKLKGRKVNVRILR